MAKNKPHTYQKKENGKNYVGRPTAYKPEYCQDMIDYFAKAERFVELQASRTVGGPAGNTEKYIKIPAKMPTFSRYADKIGVHDDTLNSWCEEYKEFFGAYSKCKELQKDWLVEIGNSGIGSTPFVIFLTKNVTDMRDKVEQDINLKTYEHFKSEKGEFSK